MFLPLCGCLTDCLSVWRIIQQVDELLNNITFGVDPDHDRDLASFNGIFIIAILCLNYKNNDCIA